MSRPLSCRAPRATPSGSESSRVRTACLLLAIMFSSPASAVDVLMTGVDLHTLGRVVFGEIKAESYELPDELANEKTVSVRWTTVESRDLVQRYRVLLESRGYTVVQTTGVYRVVPVADHVDLFTARNRPLSDVLDMMTGWPGVRVRAASSTPGASSDVAGDLVKPGKERDRDLSSVVIAGKRDQVQTWLKAAKALDIAPESLTIRAAVFEVTLSDGDMSALSLAGKLTEGAHKANIEADTAKGAIGIGFGGLSLTVAALQRDSRFKLLSQPHVSVVSGDSARLAVGTKLPILSETTTTDGGRQTQSVRYVDAGVVLEVTPIKRGDVWDINVQQEVSSAQSLDAGVVSNPTFNSRTVKTRLRGSVGDVLVLAGLDSDEAGRSRSEVPFMRWFGSRSTTNQRSQVLLLLQLDAPLDGRLEWGKITSAGSF